MGNKFTLQVKLHQQPFAKDYSKSIAKEDGVERVILGTTGSREAAMAHPKEVTKTFERHTLGKALVITPDNDFYNHYGIRSPYGIYNWEIDYHLPMLIANRLSQTQRYEEAQRWYHFIFDPTKMQDGSAWIFKPFRDEPFNTIEQLLSDTDHQDYKAWFENPFQPHAVASFRIEAFMMYTLMKYLDNLIEWGDHLFRRDTIESINEATQYFILASSLLGPKPKSVPKQIGAPLTYLEIRAKRTEGTEGLKYPKQAIHLNAPYNTDDTSAELKGTSTLFGIVANVPYFGVPANAKLLAYWETVADRLFKIRNCQNIEGIFRELPLFEPPIDPAMLIRAAQAGLDLGAVINDLYAPMPHYRFQVMLQKANEYCNEVKAFGNALLSALEKKDNEQLGIIRARHEKNILDLTRQVKASQKLEAETSMQGLQINHQSAGLRYTHYEKMLGNAAAVVPAYSRTVPIQDIVIDPQGFSKVIMSDTEGGIKIIGEEQQELDENNAAERDNKEAYQYDFYAGIVGMLPNINIQPWGNGVTWGSSNVVAALNSVSATYKNQASGHNIQASKLAKIGSWILRQDEWMQQSKLAALEINQLKRQILAADIRTEIAQKEIDNHEAQIRNSQEILDFIAGDESLVKFASNSSLYNWMVGQLMMLYRQSYKMAHDLAKQAERCYRNEVGITDSNFIQFNYWDDDKKGLLAGDRLANALKQMEKAYLDQNKREYEITKHISLALLDPMALIRLRATGVCEFEVPEALFDLDFAGQYFRRIKSVSVSLPCIAGPYTSVSAKLSLVKNK